MGVELSLRVVVTILECCVTFSGVKLSIRSFVLFRGKCPPYNQICKGCGKKNHFKAVCKAKHVIQIVAESSCDSESDDEAKFFVGSITSCTTGDDTFDVTASLKQLEILSEEIAEYQNELENRTP